VADDSWEDREGDIPKSRILKTPGTLELARRLAPLSSAGLDDRPWTAESTFDNGAGPASADMVEEGGFTGNQGDRGKGGFVVSILRTGIVR
jgi:hypothetical protein